MKLTNKEFLACIVALVTVAIFVLVPLVYGNGSEDVSNREFASLDGNFTNAIITTQDRTIETTVDSWTLSENSQLIQIVTTDGETYLTHVTNVVLY